MDDGHADLPPQPRARQAARRAPRAARRPAARADGGPDAASASGLPRRPTQPVEIPAGPRRGRDAAHRDATSRSCSRSRETFAIPPLRPSAYVVERGGEYKSIAVADGTARPQGPDRLPFGQPPQVGDALYLGFDEDISNLLMRVEIDGSMARGAGVDPEDPPLRWEMSDGSDGWAEAEVLDGPHRRIQLRRGDRRAAVPAAIRGRAARRATRCAGCGAGSRARPAAATPGRPTRTRRRSIRSRPRRSARWWRPSTARPRTRGVARTQRRHARASVFRCGSRRCSR